MQWYYFPVDWILPPRSLLRVAREYNCYSLSVDYGQRHRVELVAAARVARAHGAIEQRVIKLDLTVFGGSALTDINIAVPVVGVKEGIPVTYVPARNTICCRLRWRGQKRWTLSIYSSAPTRSIILAIRTADPNSCKRSRRWRISRPRPRSKVQNSRCTRRLSI